MRGEVIWDDDPLTTKPVAFDRSYYVGQRYLERLSPEAFACITANID